MTLNKKNIIKELRDYIMIGIAMVSYSIGWNIFLLPNSIAIGGVPGIASVVFWGIGIPVQLTYFLINAVLLIIALRILGFRFCTKTIFGVIVLTVMTTVVQNATAGSQLLHDQPFMASIIGAIFCGSGVGLAFAFRGSTGGTDIVAAIVNKYRDISLGRIIMFMDLIIISSSYLVFHDWEKVIYGYVVLLVMSFCIDEVVHSMQRSVQFFIISDRYREIASRIAVYPHRGATVIEAQGFHTSNTVKMLFIMAKRRESSIIFSIINEIDPKAFVTQTNVIGVYGEGFDKFKVRGSRQSHVQNTSPQSKAHLTTDTL
jgi:uncharacterized membrane-anchored protein YitT (DUF2179 family)